MHDSAENGANAGLSQVFCKFLIIKREEVVIYEPNDMLKMSPVLGLSAIWC